MFITLTSDLNNGDTYNGLNWAFQVMNILDRLGLSNLWHLDSGTDISYDGIKIDYLINTTKH